MSDGHAMMGNKSKHGRVTDSGHSTEALEKQTLKRLSNFEELNT